MLALLVLRLLLEVRALSADLLQRRREIGAKHLVVQMTSATSRWEQQGLGVFRNVGVEVVLEISPDVRRLHSLDLFTTRSSCIPSVSTAARIRGRGVQSREPKVG